MPVYEYQCTQCKKTFDYLQKITDAPKKKCEKCGGKLEKLLSTGGFQLKGSGWYKTDYASKPANDSGVSPSSGSNTKPKTDSTKKSD